MRLMSREGWVIGWLPPSLREAGSLSLRKGRSCAKTHYHSSTLPNVCAIQNRGKNAAESQVRTARKWQNVPTVSSGSSYRAFQVIEIADFLLNRSCDILGTGFAVRPSNVRTASRVVDKIRVPEVRAKESEPRSTERPARLVRSRFAGSHGKRVR